MCGVDVMSRRVEALRSIGYAPENPTLFQSLTVRESLDLIGSLRGMEEGEVEDAMEPPLNRGRPTKAAFMVKPRVLVLDEPMSGMDPEAQRA